MFWHLPAVAGSYGDLYLFTIIKPEACTSSSQLAEQSTIGWLIAALDGMFLLAFQSAFGYDHISDRRMYLFFSVLS
ncbi:hypothetical protein [Methanolobus sp.]|uniref:hypothetical protein n=1 Tax=Methanolobus sp. TaxID=1874737 RepID=UPI0025FCAC81|nr:hypothetical protein [Methanolobus sp.]